jgi:hypothetical protein
MLFEILITIDNIIFNINKYLIFLIFFCTDFYHQAFLFYFLNFLLVFGYATLFCYLILILTIVSEEATTSNFSNSLGMQVQINTFIYKLHSS